jgi:hypothetical protein
MTKFTSANLVNIKGTHKVIITPGFANAVSYYPDYRKIYCDKADLIINETWWQKKNLSYTRTGYGNKIPTRYMINFEGRNYRVYCRVYSNSGTCYIVRKGEEIVIDAT